jgi:hypothetical protein
MFLALYCKHKKLKQTQEVRDEIAGYFHRFNKNLVVSTFNRKFGHLFKNKRLANRINAVKALSYLKQKDLRFTKFSKH